MRVRITLVVGVFMALFAATPAQADNPEDPVWCLVHWSHC